MSFLSWIILGAIAGVIARKVLPDAAPKSKIITIGIGVLGAMIGGMVSSLFLGVTVTGPFSVPSLVISAIGAIGLLAAYHYCTRRFSNDTNTDSGEHQKLT